MKKKSALKAALCAIITAGLAVSAAASANAQVTEEIPVKAVAANEYSDTYKAYLNGEIDVDESSGVKIAPYAISGTTLEPSGSLPSSYYTETTEIRNQGSNQTCWAFSGIGALEAFLSNEGKGDVDLSEQHLAWWATAFYNDDDGTGWLNRSLAPGGYSMTSAGYFASWQGPKLESDLPYRGSSYPSGMKDYPNAYNVTGIKYVDSDITSLKTAIYNYGAVATSYNNGAGYNDNKSCYYQDEYLTRFYGHAITVIGWDDNFSADNFSEYNRPPADGAWLAKNSWGSGMGAKGYLWISYYDRYAFNTDVWGSNIAITSVKTATPYDKIYQNENYGATYYTYMSDNSGNNIERLTFANLFDFDSEHKYLESVVFETLNQGSLYTVYYIPVEKNKPVTDESRWTALSSGTVDSTGYIKAETNGFDIPSGKGAIGVTIDGSVVNDYAAIGVNEWLDNKNGEKIFMPSPKKGDSFVITGNKAYDLLDVYASNNDDIGGTLVIKAITTSNIIGDVDGDGVSSVSDSLSVLRYSVGLNQFDEEQSINADVNFDNELDVLDALQILRKTVDIIAEY